MQFPIKNGRKKCKNLLKFNYQKKNLLIKILIGGIKMKFNEKLVMLRKQQNKY